MKLNTNLPYGWKAIIEHLSKGAMLTRNVGEEADRAFMRELEREDPQRHHRLMKNILANGKADRGKCQHCSLPLPLKDRRSDAKFCDGTCKRNAAFARAGKKRLLIVAHSNLSVENASIGVAF